MAEFARIMQNEWIKLVRRRRFLVVLLLGLALVGFYTFTQYQDMKRSEKYNDPAYQKQMMQSQIDNLQRMKEDPSVPAERKSRLDEQIQAVTADMQRLEREGKPAAPQYDESKQKQELETLNNQLAAAPTEDKKMRGQLEYQIKIAEYRIEHQLPAAGGFNQDAWRSIKQFLDIGSQVFIPLLCVLLVADMVSGEQTGGTIKLLLTRPPSRGKILLAKYVTAVLGSVLVVAILLGVLTGALVGVFGTDGAMNPTAVGLNYASETQIVNGKITQSLILDPSNAVFLPTGRFILISLLLTLLASVAMCTLGFFCSMLVRSAAVSTGIALAVIIIGNIIVHSAEGLSWLTFFITPHFDLPFAWTGELSQQFAVPMSLVQSLTILSVWVVVMYGIGHFLFKKRDVLG